MSITNTDRPTGTITNSNKVVDYETWDTNTTTWDTETRTWDEMQSTWDNVAKPTTAITNSDKP
jgi:hypothetical protein